MKKLLIVPLLFALAFAYPASGLELSQTGAELCATDTALFVFSVANSANFQDSFTVALSGDAAKWAVAAPAGFNLEPGQAETVYVYVTPSISALPGDHELKITVSSLEQTESATATVKVKDCHSAVLTAENTEESVCSATKASYRLNLQNTGKYTENFALSLSGTAAKWGVLSEELVKLGAGESKNIIVTVTPPADQTGDFALTVTASSQNSNALAEQPLELTSEGCYGFSTNADVNYVSFCENSEAKIPFSIENKGSVDNTYTLSIKGPLWSTVENTKLAIPAGEARFTNVVLFPGYGVAGEFPITVKIRPEKGAELEEQEIIANVKSCYSADVKLSAVEDTICPNTEKAYSVSVANTGEFAARYALTATGADFAGLDTDFVDLEPNESSEFNLVLNPKDTDTGKHKITVRAEAQDTSKSSSAAELDLNVAPIDNCFGVEATSALTKAEVAPGEPAVIPIIVANKGVENSTYNLEVSGTGAQFTQLNPASVTLQGKAARTVYAYVAVPEGTSADTYRVTVAARLKDGTVSSTTGFDISVVGKVEEKETISEKLSVESRTANIRAAIISFFSSVKERLYEGFAALTPTQEAPPPEKNETNETLEIPAKFLSEAARKKLEENATTKEAEAGNKTANETAAPLANATQYLSEAARKKLEEAKSAELPESSAKERLSENISSLATGFATVVDFLKERTYYIPNWLFILAAVAVVAGLSFLLRKKELVDRFNKFLEEEEETKKGPSAQELLDESEKRKPRRKRK